ncbi:hypothetical protein [Sphingorhabdus sp. M41]|uniref:hypothetical protein n=1 Tax=Sphingorhabdus sp. M41 TaxID=1806885 RepID=UPI00078CEB93|nr:hypothetical protein [Sphingorhabdus sp. M41]AMO72884.1 hypothetical protein AZE99_14425 [Sphingorhabdus sp. M41]
MKKKIATAFHWTRAQSFCDKGNVNAALNSLGKIPELSSMHRAFLGTLLILDGKSGCAKEQFNIVIDHLSKPELAGMDENVRYVKAYCQLYVSLIEKNDSDEEQYWNIARDSMPDNALSRWLKLPDITKLAHRNEGL